MTEPEKHPGGRPSEQVAVKDLKAWSRNPRKIDQARLENLKRSMTQDPDFLRLRPILALTDGTVYAGNQRLKAAKELGLEKVWAVLEDVAETTMKARALRDNNQWGEWEPADLAAMLGELPDDLQDMLGFDDLQSMKAEQLEVVEDKAPEPPKEPKSKPGDIYILGEHRLLCGDATKIDDVERLMDGQKADMVFTDPPYGISIVGSSGGVGGGTEGKYRPVLGDDSIQTAIDSYNLCASLFPAAKLIFWGGNYYAQTLPNSPCWVVWDKQGGKSVTFADCELAWTNFDTPVRMFTHIWDGFRRDSEKGEMRVHPTQKPVKLLADIMAEYADTTTTHSVLDLFGGSGSTLIACEQTKRKCFMMELDPRYIDVIVQRWEKLTGNKAQLLNG